jgi:hypothetical protein
MAASSSSAQTIVVGEEDFGSSEVWEKLAFLVQENRDGTQQQGDESLEDIELWVQEFLEYRDPPGRSRQELVSKQVESLRYASISDLVQENRDGTQQHGDESLEDIELWVQELLEYMDPPGRSRQELVSKQVESLMIIARKHIIARKRQNEMVSCSRLPSIPEEGHRIYTSI